MKVENTHSNGIGFLGLLTIVFIILKLCKVINWSWWLVLLPLWLPILVIVVVIIGIFLGWVVTRER